MTEEPAKPGHRARNLGLVAAVIVFALGAAVIAFFTLRAPSSDATVDRYVALGDSYTAGTGIVDLVGKPSQCFRSGHNYPNLVHRRLVANGVDLAPLVDGSCSGATVNDLYEPQQTQDGANRAQLDLVDEGTKVVTVGIGVNDIEFSSFMLLCIQQPAPTGCKAHFVANGDDALRTHIADLRPRITKVISDIHTQAPDALVVIVGYPTILPGSGSCPTLDVPADDISYVSGVFDDLNAALASQANANGAVFVDTATSSVGHDMCAGPDAWINPPGTELGDPPDGISLHPDAAGMTHTAGLVTAAIQAHLDD